MKNLILIILTLLLYFNLSSQEHEGQPKIKAKTTIFARYVLIGNVQNKPFLHINALGVNVSYKRLSTEISYLRNYTAQKNGALIAIGFQIWKKPLGKHFGIGVKALTEAGILLNNSNKHINFQTIGTGVGVKAFLTKDKNLFLSLATPVFAKRLQIGNGTAKYSFEYRIVVGINYTF